MIKKRPCKICGRWFRASNREGDRQRTCTRRECQRERHRRNCKQWRERNRYLEKEGRVRDRLIKEGGGGAVRLKVDLEAVRDSVGPEQAVLIEEIVKVLNAGARDSDLPERPKKKK